MIADATDSNGRASATVRQLAFLNAAFETGRTSLLSWSDIGGEDSHANAVVTKRWGQIAGDRYRLNLLVRRAMGGDVHDVRVVLSQPRIDGDGVRF